MSEMIERWRKVKNEIRKAGGSWISKKVFNPFLAVMSVFQNG